MSPEELKHDVDEDKEMTGPDWRPLKDLKLGEIKNLRLMMKVLEWEPDYMEVSESYIRMLYSEFHGDIKAL